jgi:hypothetical protein
MKSDATTRFWRLFNALPADVKRQARRAFASFRKDPFAPQLEFKQLKGHTGCGRRASTADIESSVYARETAFNGTGVEWNWIGTHDEYLRQLRRRP